MPSLHLIRSRLVRFGLHHQHLSTSSLVPTHKDLHKYKQSLGSDVRMWGLWESQSTKNKRLAQEEAARKARQDHIIHHNTSNFRKAGLGMLISGSAAIAAAFFCRRSIIARRYVPKQFDTNVHPPKFNPMKDAARAVVDATLLATTTFGFAVTSLFWVYDAGNLRELGQTLTRRYSPEREYPDDPETAKIERDLTAMLFSKPSKSKE